MDLFSSLYLPPPCVEAINYIFTHVENALSLLHKKAITKEVLFRYLHHRRVPVTHDFSKANLIQKVLDLWTSSGKGSQRAGQLEQNVVVTVAAQKELLEERGAVDEVEMEAKVMEEPRGLPVHNLARQFAEWFFQNFNKSSLKASDLWLDVKLLLRVVAEDGHNNYEASDAESSVQVLNDIQETYNFLFNPNLSMAGVQGRMDVYGLVVILCCGTLHSSQGDFVGLFECAFRILRDPVSDNNWKLKDINLLMRSSAEASVPSLQDSVSLTEALALPIPTGELT